VDCKKRIEQDDEKKAKKALDSLELNRYKRRSLVQYGSQESNGKGDEKKSKSSKK